MDLKSRQILQSEHIILIYVSCHATLNHSSSYYFTPIPLPTIAADPPTTPHTPTPTTHTPLTPPPPTAPPDPPATPHTPPTPPTPNPPTPSPHNPPSTNTPPPETILSHLPPPIQMPKDHQNVITVDSLVKGLNVKNSIHICQGRIYPNQVLLLLPTSSDVLPPECYNEVKTLTLIVGTNALNVTEVRTIYVYTAHSTS